MIAFHPTTSDDSIHVARFSFSEEGFVWHTKVKCPTVANCFTNSTLLAYDKDNDIVYVGSQAINNPNFIAGLKAGDGSSTGLRFRTSGAESTIKNLDVFNGIVNFSFRKSSPFTESQTSLFESKTNKLIASGNPTYQNGKIYP